ncbi:putative glycosomal membrane protein [Trypanosoma cruzi]|uniref:Glycosomal membrane protein, putative n=2 Tax=Trypanosoma cruzi TaxID=5693 RepID=Q4D418_TRYCC|nr:glycosomal membrane protein, putative [Trypanosoma cruzi]EAN87271.1 glycosomal membrane protein, putative [Trypanosoma cruzi]PWU93348.1 putative glycosomal membrane protein [Trypanosoma cruzi]RNC46171.1 glycosomal membrane protein [Trypanosoma cruzi]|eukprot:XP_809122.1 glycosomal membrane protein [Trypanosoma cruzi strain CL Brener]
MSDFDKFVKLLGQTDGRDKIYKFVGGVLKALAALDAVECRRSAYKSVSSSITDGRSLMRMAKWMGDIPKMRSVFAKCAEGGRMEMTALIMFLRVLGNFLYILGDNVAFLMRYKLVPGQPKRVQYHSKVSQFWGFFFAAVLDLLALRTALQKRASDAATSCKEAKSALINLTKDASDVLVTMAAVGYMKGVWHPGPVTAGALTAVSGGVATYLNWKKIK